MIRRFLLPVLFAYAVEAVLLAILWFEVPFLAGIAGLLQVPSAASAHSPVELLITNAAGQKTGYDPTTGTILQQIPGSTYTRESIADDEDPANEPPTEEVKTVDLHGSSSGGYTVQVIGTGFGPFTIDVLAYDSAGKPQLQSFTGTASQGSQGMYNVVYSATPGVPLVVVPTDSVPPTTPASSRRPEDLPRLLDWGGRF